MPLAPENPAPSMFVQFMPILAIGVLFYFLLIRPQQKQQRKVKDMLSALKKGDRVLTSGGLYGHVVGMHEKDDVVVLRISDQVKVEVSRKSISSVVEVSAGEAEPGTLRS